MSDERTAKDVIVEYQFSMQEGSYGTNPATIKAEFMSYTDLKLLFAEINSLRADLARLRELLGEVVRVGGSMRNDFNQFGGGGWITIWDDLLATRVQSELKE